MSDGERACLVPSKELKLEARQNFNTFQLLFIPLSFFKLLNLAVDLTASSGSTPKRHANHLVSTRGGREPAYWVMSRYLIDIDYIALPLHCVPGFARSRAVVLGGGSCPRITRVARSMRKQEGAPHHVWAATTAESGMADVDSVASMCDCGAVHRRRPSSEQCPVIGLWWLPGGCVNGEMSDDDE